jgi:hypothetical protein
MKKIYLSLLSLVAVISIKAQLTQANHAPVASHTFEMYDCAAATISAGANGANANWNFASITTNSSVVLSFVSGTSANSSYPVGSIVVAASASNSAYYTSSANDLKYYGGNVSAGGNVVNLIYSNSSPAVFASYPMNLNTTTTSAIAGTIVVPALANLSGNFTGSCNVLVSGSGSLTMPGSNATFTNALKVITSQTLNITSAFVTATVLQTSYEYYSIGIRAPIFSIQTSTFSTSLAAPTTQTIMVRNKNANTLPPPSGTGLFENSSLSINMNVFPNPSTTEINFITDNVEAKHITVFDITGKLVEKYVLTDKKLKLEVSNYRTGLYLYTVTNKNNETLKTGKLTISH